MVERGLATDAWTCSPCFGWVVLLIESLLEFAGEVKNLVWLFQLFFISSVLKMKRNLHMFFSEHLHLTGQVFISCCVDFSKDSD